MLIKNDQYEEALKLLKPQLLNITSIEIEAYQCMHNLAGSYIELGKFEKAKQYFLKALKGLPDNKDIIGSLFSIYRFTNKIEEAEKLLPSLKYSKLLQFIFKRIHN